MKKTFLIMGSAPGDGGTVAESDHESAFARFCSWNGSNEEECLEIFKEAFGCALDDGVLEGKKMTIGDYVVTEYE